MTPIPSEYHKNGIPIVPQFYVNFYFDLSTPVVATMNNKKIVEVLKG